MGVPFNNDETVWRLIDFSWCKNDPVNGLLVVDEAAFQNWKGISVVRPLLLGMTPVAYVQQRFPRHGIAELDSKLIPSVGTENGGDGCILEIEDDLQHWPKNAHVVIKKAPDGSRLKARHAVGLAALANRRPLVLFPKP
jgi:hypothetical protein